MAVRRQMRYKEAFGRILFTQILILKALQVGFLMNIMLH